jgi:hypothetical protein
MQMMKRVSLTGVGTWVPSSHRQQGEVKNKGVLMIREGVIYSDFIRNFPVLNFEKMKQIIIFGLPLKNIICKLKQALQRISKILMFYFLSK